MLTWNGPNEDSDEKKSQGARTDSSDVTDGCALAVSNDEFLEAIFGINFELAMPLVCCKPGDPSDGGWMPSFWPCFTSDPGLNWYFCPGVYMPDESGQARAKSQLAQAVYVICLDDVGTKVPMEVLNKLVPTWLNETSPGNYQAGYLFNQPTQDLEAVERLKNKLIENGRCDPGASGGSARWMRLPVGINGKRKYGPEGVQCRLVHWAPSNRYSLAEIERALIDDDRGDTELSANSPKGAGDPVVQALQERGQYLNYEGAGRHEIVCPWWEQHSDPTDTKSYYFEPSKKFPMGGFKCFHSHGKGLGIRSLLDHLNISTQDVSIKPVVVVQPGHIGRVVDDAEQALAKKDGVYHFQGMLCSVRQDAVTSDVQVKPLGRERLLLDVSDAAIWEKHMRNGDIVVIDPPSKYVNILLDKGEYIHIPQLCGVARQPYFFGDFQFSNREGYDFSSGIFGAFRAEDFILPETPTLEQARQALGELKNLLSEFRFQSQRDLDAALAAMFTAVVRPSLPAAPMFHVRAPQIASGKSYLCNLLAAFAGPGSPSASAFPENQEESQKLVFSLLMDSPAVVIFDNLTGDLLPYTSLCSALTEESIQGRILGVSKTARVSTKTFFLSSGNNVGPVKDMTRRTVVICLNPQTELASDRDFKFDPLSMVKSRRSHYVSLVLTVINAWLAFGRPMTNCRKLASYDRWSEMTRQPLMWLGVSDPAAGLYTAQEDDPEKQMLVRLLMAWKHCFGSVPTMVRDAVSYANSGFAHAGELREAFEDVAERNGQIDRRTLGKYLSRSEGRVVGNMSFSKASKTMNAERWSVQTLSGVSSVMSVESVEIPQEKSMRDDDEF